MDDNEICWTTGVFTDLCDCNLCPHRFECSGSEMEEDEE